MTCLNLLPFDTTFTTINLLILASHSYARGSQVGSSKLLVFPHHLAYTHANPSALDPSME